MPELLMPRLSDSMEEATVIEWLKQPGDDVAIGDELALIETDKATVPLEATEAGTLLEVLVAAGETVALGAPLVRIGDAATGDATEPRAKASPVARRIAGEHGVNLLTITGTGPAGRIVKADVRAALEAAGVAAEPAVKPVEPPAVVVPEPVVVGRSVPGASRPLTRLQQTVARRMSEAKTVPEFVVRMQVDMEACAEIRGRLKGRSLVPTYNDMVVKACALALTEHPLANGRYEDDAIVQNDHVNVGIAVAGEGTLLVPVIRDADTLPLAEIAVTSAGLAARARTGTATPAELSGATFTVSNLGMFGVSGFTAIINPPQAAILAVGAVTRQPVVREDQLMVRYATELTLTCDHRILYGADAARFLQRVRELLEEPLVLML